jgi:hypothetical protein
MPTEAPLVGDAADTLRALLPLLERKADRGFLLEPALAEALAHDGPAQVDVLVNPDEPPMPGKVSYDKAKGFLQAWLRGQPRQAAIASTLFRDKLEQLRWRPRAAAGGRTPRPASGRRPRSRPRGRAGGPAAAGRFAG